MRTSIMLAMLSLPIIAAPAAAQQGSASNQSQAAKQPQGKPAKYCFKLDGGTGSRIESTVCKTKAQWAKEGVNVGS